MPPFDNRITAEQAESMYLEADNNLQVLANKKLLKPEEKQLASVVACGTIMANKAMSRTKA